MTINLNDRVRAQLTEDMVQHIAHSPREFTIRPDESRMITASLWVLMAELGPYTYIGRPTPIERCEVEVLSQ